MKEFYVPRFQCPVFLLVFLFTLSGYANGLDGNSKRTVRSLKRVPIAKVRALSRQIDDMIVKSYKEHEITPNSISSDSLFLRRIYLEVIGRIPSYQEATAFLDSPEPAKRSRLIDHLLNSEGYVSREFNYWADLLRIQSRMRNVPGQPYIDWLKKSLRQNKPYDQLVSELISAEGYIWEDGAAGYYLRDAGMPLDHMSNTFQVFLGTQLVCAQCHDHPYDDWSQRDYYEQSAFIYGVKTADPKVNRKFRMFGARAKNDNVSAETKVMARRIVRPLRYRVNETPSKLRLPDDYQYEDAKPKSVVEPATIFGNDIELSEGESPRDAYARWLTSHDNPRFSTVIANRLWKRVMGLGLIEPVDDLKEDYTASNPELMKFLAQTLIDLKFDLKQYLRVLYNTRTFHRMVSTDELVAGEDYAFPGPILARMSAEQLWDSFVGLIVPDVDDRRGVQRTDQRYAMAKELVGKDSKEILAIAESESAIDKVRRDSQEKIRTLQKRLEQLEKLGNGKGAKQLKQEIAAVRKNASAANSMSRSARYGGQRSKGKRVEARWKGLPAYLVRASELQSPAPNQHFLRQFGQSDRETIENSDRSANVPQILTLMNGPIYTELQKPQSLFNRNIKAASAPMEKLEIIFVSILSRRPTIAEANALGPEFHSRGNKAAADISWALLNTREFAFVQ